MKPKLEFGNQKLKPTSFPEMKNWNRNWLSRIRKPKTKSGNRKTNSGNEKVNLEMKNVIHETKWRFRKSIDETEIRFPSIDDPVESISVNHFQKSNSDSWNEKSEEGVNCQNLSLIYPQFIFSVLSLRWEVGLFVYLSNVTFKAVFQCPSASKK